MKAIRFFSKFTLICNVAFLLFLLFNRLEQKKPGTTTPGVVEAIPFFKNLIITLGFSAIVINLIMCLVYVLFLVAGKKNLVPVWLAVINFIFLVIQFYFFFF